MTILPIIRWLLIVVATACATYGQSFGAGVKVGALATAPFESTSVTISDATLLRSEKYFPKSPRLILGPMVELRLPRRLAVEVSVIHRRIRYSSESHVREIIPDPFLPLDETLRFDTLTRGLELAILLKYRFTDEQVRPFVSAGYSVRWALDIEREVQTDSGPVRLPRSALGTVHRTSPGFVVVGGVEWQIFAVRIAPEIRDTHWYSPGLVSSANQLEALLNVGF